METWNEQAIIESQNRIRNMTENEMRKATSKVIGKIARAYISSGAIKNQSEENQKRILEDSKK